MAADREYCLSSSSNGVSWRTQTTGLPGGDTTVQVLRPDAVTGAPVTIGEYTDSASILPFTVNMTVPTAFDPDGDCWQSGALTLPGGLGLTPAIRAGDTVTLSSGLSLTLPAGADAGGGGGPIFGCSDISAYADNAVTAATRIAPPFPIEPVQSKASAEANCHGLPARMARRIARAMWP